MARWFVYMIRKRAEYFGTVVAANEKEAIEKAVKQFRIDPTLWNKIVVTKIADND
jgi:hypothetical protein